MATRLSQLRTRLAPLLAVTSDAIRADIEELFALAERAASVQGKSTSGAAPAGVTPDRNATRGRDEENGKPDRSLPEVLSAILAGSAVPMRVRDLTDAALAGGWTTTSGRPAKLVSGCLSTREEFVAVGRGLYSLREGAGGAVGAPSAPSEAELRDANAPPPADAAPVASEPRALREVLVGVLRRSGGPMRVRDLADAALASGWTTTSASPRNVVAACLNGRSEFVSVGRGEYVLRGADDASVAPERVAVPPVVAEPRRAARSNAEHPPTANAPSLRVLLREVLADRGVPMRAAELVEALYARGWTTTSPSPRDVISAVLTGKPEFVAVGRGVYALRDPQPAPRTHASEVEIASADAPDAPRGAATEASEPSARRPVTPSPRESEGLPPGVLRRAEAGPGAAPSPTVAAPAPPKPRFSPEVAEVGAELEFLLQQVADARADTAVLAPDLLRLQITLWIARARELNDRARGHGEIARATGRVAAELGDLCKRWWPGSVEAMKLDTLPYQALRPFADAPDDPSALTWASVADRLDALMAAKWAEPGFDDGWKDTRWLCDDERFVEERLREAEDLLARLGTPIEEPPLRRAVDLRLASDDVPQLVHAARGLRWVRSVVTDGLRWGLAVGRLRWIAATHPGAARSALAQVLSADYQPLGSGWGFDELLRRERKEQLVADLAGADLPGWLSRAIDVFDNPELARLLVGRGPEIAAIDSAALGSRRARGRVRKLAAMLGVQVAEGAANAAATTTPEPDAREPEAQAATFTSVRTALLDRVRGNRALFISNREDTPLREKLAATFGLDLEWCVAHPRRVDAATDAIRRGRYHVILSATGFQDHTMDAAFSRAARDSSTLYVRVNRGRPAACARAIARELGLRDAS